MPRIIYLTLACLVLLPLTSHAQDTYEGSKSDPTDFLLPATSTVLVLGTSTVSIYGTYALSSNSDEVAQNYIKERELDIATGLATGEGPFVEEMMKALKVEDHQRKAFTHLLLQRYTELSELASADRVTPDRARRFFDTISEIRQQL